MFDNTLNQGFEFLWAVYGGVVIGLLYDFFRILRLTFKMGRVLVAVLDILFWLIAAAIVTLVIIVMNGGTIRLFAIAGCILGSATYFAGPSLLIIGLYNRSQKKIEELKASEGTDTENL